MPYVVIAALASMLGFLEARVIDAPWPVEVGVGLLVGLVWTVLAALVARAVRPGPRRAATVAITAIVASAMLLAPGIILHLMYGAPADYLAVQQSRAASATVAYYATLNPLSEWVLIPLAVYLAWPEPARRRPIVIAATIYYLERLTTYLYFAPHILGWSHEPATPALIDSVGTWLTLDWARIAVNAVCIVLLARGVIAGTAHRRHVPVPRTGVAPDAAMRGVEVPAELQD
jgi:hypothetical protein